MSRRYSITLSLLLFVVFATRAQVMRPQVSVSGVVPGKATPSGIMHEPLAGEIYHSASDGNLNYFLRNLEEREAGFEHVKAIKNSYPAKRNQNFTAEKADETQVITPVIGQQYDTNIFDGSYPPDNNIAVSNAGWIVSVTNSSVRYYNASGVLKGNKSFETFANDASLTSILYDPKILYDSGSDRFFLCFLHGYTSSTSKVLVFFSKTNDPMDGWNYYKLTVSSAVASRWADFPSIGVSNNEVYVTVNLFNNSDQFDKVLLYQIDKNTGYNNQTLAFQTWTNITDDQGDPPFTLVPVSYGQQGNYGPGVVLVATEDPGSSNKVQVFDLTQDMNNSPQLNGYHANIPAFNIGANALQPTGEDLDIGDCRMKSGFFLNNVVHCVFTSNYSNGWNGINYSRINLSGMTADNQKFGAIGRDIGYPAGASFTHNVNDKTVVIGYEESSQTINPALKAVVCDDGMTFGSAITLKAGTSNIDVEDDPGSYERWGDYLGIHRRNSTNNPTVWVFGIYGKTTSSFGVYGNNAVELINTTETGLVEAQPENNHVDIYPNPVENYFTVNIEANENADAKFELYDASGKLVKHMATKSLTPGEFQFGFNMAALPAGVYFLRIKTATKTLANEKVVVQ